MSDAAINPAHSLRDHATSHCCSRPRKKNSSASATTHRIPKKVPTASSDVFSQPRGGMRGPANPIDQARTAARGRKIAK